MKEKPDAETAPKDICEQRVCQTVQSGATAGTVHEMPVGGTHLHHDPLLEDELSPDARRLVDMRLLEQEAEPQAHHGAGQQRDGGVWPLGRWVVHRAAAHLRRFRGLFVLTLLGPAGLHADDCTHAAQLLRPRHARVAHLFSPVRTLARRRVGPPH